MKHRTDSAGLICSSSGYRGTFQPPFRPTKYAPCRALYPRWCCGHTGHDRFARVPCTSKEKSGTNLAKTRLACTWSILRALETVAPRRNGISPRYGGLYVVKPVRMIVRIIFASQRPYRKFGHLWRTIPTFSTTIPSSLWGMGGTIQGGVKETNGRHR